MNIGVLIGLLLGIGLLGFAAFDGADNVRGVAVQLFPPFGPYHGEIVYEMQLRSNAEGDILNFKYYVSYFEKFKELLNSSTININFL